MSVRPTLELRNFWLLPNDIHALAFVANAAGDDGVGLDFGSCSMELECLDVLTTCRNIHRLRWEDKNNNCLSCTPSFHEGNMQQITPLVLYMVEQLRR